MKWIMLLIQTLPKKKIADLIVKVLEYLAKETDNSVDDELVSIIKAMLDTVFPKR